MVKVDNLAAFLREIVLEDQPDDRGRDEIR